MHRPAARWQCSAAHRSCRSIQSESLREVCLDHLQPDEYEEFLNHITVLVSPMAMTPFSFRKVQSSLWVRLRTRLSQSDSKTPSLIPRSSGAPTRRFEGEKLPCPLSAGHTLGDGDFTSHVTAASKLEDAKIYSLHFRWSWEQPWRYGEPGWGIGTQQVEGRRRRRKQESERC